MEKIKGLAAIKRYFGSDPGKGYREVTLAELKELDTPTRQWMGAESARMLGMELDTAQV